MPENQEPNSTFVEKIQKWFGSLNFFAFLFAVGLCYIVTGIILLILYLYKTADAPCKAPPNALLFVATLIGGGITLCVVGATFVGLLGYSQIRTQQKKEKKRFLEKLVREIKVLETNLKSHFDGKIKELETRFMKNEVIKELQGL